MAISLNTNFFSLSLMKSVNVNILYPQESVITAFQKDAREPDEEYPILYLLHGMGDDCNSWLRFTSLARYAQSKRVIIVMPEADVSFYTDMQGIQNYETMIVEELPKMLSNVFLRVPTKRERISIGGLSMGGYGAMRIGLKHPETYGSIYAMSGVYRLDENRDKRPDVPDVYWKLIFDNAPRIEGSIHDVRELAKMCLKKCEDAQISLPRIELTVGDKDFLREDSIYMQQYLTDLGYAPSYQEYEGGHTYHLWDQIIEEIIMNQY